jgi:hypothetical protein
MRLYVILKVGLRNREVRFTPGNRYNIRGMDVRFVPILLQKSVEIGGEPFRSADANLGEVDS